MKQNEVENKMMHIALSSDQVGGYAFLPGSPERVPRIAAFLDEAHELGQHREHRSWTGRLEGEKVTVISTGMGGPSTVICLEELIKLGVHTFVRVGSCASMSPKVKKGDIVIPSGAVRMEGTSLHYLPLEFPAVPDYFLLKELEEATRDLGYPCQVGVTITKDSFYSQTEPSTRPIGPQLIQMWDTYQKGGATNTSMECAPLFIAAGSLGVRAACLMFSATSYDLAEEDNKLYPLDLEKRAIHAAIEGLRRVILADKSAAN